MSKRYFIHEDSELYNGDSDIEYCYELETIKNMMSYHKIKEINVLEAEMIKGGDFFFCAEYSEVGEKYESCGNVCKGYKPRNGKNGRCSHSHNVYDKTDEILTIKI
jgi:hypothetical protein